MITHLLFEAHQTLFKQAVDHKFLRSIKEGTIQDKQFNVWLQQDYVFVLEFIRLMASLLEDAPPSHFNLLISGLTAIAEEKLWFEEEIKQRKLDLEPKVHENCLDYLKFMEKLRKSTYSVKLLGVFLIERVYEKAWDLGPLKGQYDKIAKRWSNKEFSFYVERLETITNETFQKEKDFQEKELEMVFQNVMELEIKFWEMAFII